jgi:hypothetical protein
VVEIGLSLLLEKPWTLGLAPLFLAIPMVTLANCLCEEVFARRWARRTVPASADGRGVLKLETREVEP